MKYFLLFFIKIYQIFLSPKSGLLRNFYFFPTHCRFEAEESCSSYAYRSIKENGVFRGLKMSLLRIGRCNGLIKD